MLFSSVAGVAAPGRSTKRRQQDPEQGLANVPYERLSPLTRCPGLETAQQAVQVEKKRKLARDLLLRAAAPLRAVAGGRGRGSGEGKRPKTSQNPLPTLASGQSLSERTRPCSTDPSSKGPGATKRGVLWKPPRRQETPPLPLQPRTDSLPTSLPAPLGSLPCQPATSPPALPSHQGRDARPKTRGLFSQQATSPRPSPNLCHKQANPLRLPGKAGVPVAPSESPPANPGTGVHRSHTALFFPPSKTEAPQISRSPAGRQRLEIIALLGISDSQRDFCCTGSPG